MLPCLEDELLASVSVSRQLSSSAVNKLANTSKPGGYLLGGGYAWISNKYGLSFDSVLSYTVVLPNATIATASKSTNPDLFWGLKGGYNNFGRIIGKLRVLNICSCSSFSGVVTSAVVQAYPNPLVYVSFHLAQSPLEARN